MRRALVIASAIAFALVVAFAIAYGPTRSEAFGDQARYESLARALVERGVYARTDGQETAPEPWRAMGYPLFLAALYATTGSIQLPAIVIQAILVVLLPALAFRLASTFASRRVSLAAAFVVALYAPLAYYSVFLLTDLPAAFLVSLGCLATVVAIERRDVRWGLAAGAGFGFAGLVRPVYAPLGLALLIGLLLIDRSGVRASWRPLAAMVMLSLALGAVPSVAYTYSNFGRPSLVAAGTGIQLWLGYWEGVWSGEMTRQIITEGPPADLPDRERAQRYRDQYLQLFRGIGSLPPKAEVANWLEADRVALGWAREEISADPAGYVARAFTYRFWVLWAAELPVPDVAQVPRAVRLLAWMPQFAIVALAAVGVLVKLRSSVAAKVVGGILLYVTVAHLPFYVDARYSVAAKPVMLVAAAVGAAWVWRVTRNVLGRRTSPRAG